jgi:hypothetical protein
MRKPPVGSLEEILEQNYTVSVLKHGPTIRFARSIFNDDPRLRLQPSSDYAPHFCSQIQNSSSKLVFLLPADIYAYGIDCDYTGVQMQTFSKHNKGFATLKNSLTYQWTRKIANKIIPTGIVEFLSQHHINNWKAQKQPKVFSIDDLAFGFFVWLFACGVSINAFVLEILWKILSVNVKVMVKKVVGLILLLKLLKQRTKILK